LADYSYYAHRDNQGASAQYEKIVRSTPNDSNAHFMLGLIFRRQGRWSQSLDELRAAFGLDPHNALFLRLVVQDLFAARRWNEAIDAQHQLIKIAGTLQFVEKIRLARLYAEATGSTHKCDEFVGSLPPEQLNSPRGIDFRMQLASWKGDYLEFKRLDASLPNFDEDGDEPIIRALRVAWVYAEHGDLDSARFKIAGFEQGFRARIVREPNNGELYSQLEQVEAIEGKREDALRDAGRAVELLPENVDALQGPEVAYTSAEVEAWLGDKDLALKKLTHLVRIPLFLTPFDLHHDAALSRLRGDQRFETLVNDPHNFEALF
jgi:tetratricopeptide (TPR) repeat protein